MSKINVVFTTLLAVLLLSSFNNKENNFYGGPKIKFIKGTTSVFKGKKSYLVKFDYSKMSVDGLETEAEYIEYKMKKKKTKEKADKWKMSWKNDQKNNVNAYVKMLARESKKTNLVFTTDDPNSDYEMLVVPSRIETGTGIKKSSVELNLFLKNIKTGKVIAKVHVPKIHGVQQGPTAPTTGMRVQVALMQSAAYFGKYLKKLNK